MNATMVVCICIYVKEFLLSMDTTSVVVLLCIKRIFIITKIVHMNEKTRLSSEKEKVKESQSRSVAPPLDIYFGCRVEGVTMQHLTSYRGRLGHDMETFIATSSR